MTEAILSDDVARALGEGRAVVALESTIFSNLGLPAPANADALEVCKQAVIEHGATPAVAAILDGRPHLGRTRPATGVLLTVPIPEADEIPESRISAVLAAALDSCADAGVTGPAVTPYVLARIEKETDGQSIPANLALARNNAAIAARVAVAMTR